MGQVARGQLVEGLGQGADGDRVLLGLAGLLGFARGALGLGLGALFGALAFEAQLLDADIVGADGKEA